MIPTWHLMALVLLARIDYHWIDLVGSIFSICSHRDSNIVLTMTMNVCFLTSMFTHHHKTNLVNLRDIFPQTVCPHDAVLGRPQKKAAETHNLLETSCVSDHSRCGAGCKLWFRSSNHLSTLIVLDRSRWGAVLMFADCPRSYSTRSYVFSGRSFYEDLDQGHGCPREKMLWRSWWHPARCPWILYRSFGDPG